MLARLIDIQYIDHILKHEMFSGLNSPVPPLRGHRIHNLIYDAKKLKQSAPGVHGRPPDWNTELPECTERKGGNFSLCDEHYSGSV